MVGCLPDPGRRISRGWIETGRGKVSRLKTLLSFLEVAVPEPLAYQEAVGFRITEAAHKSDLQELRPWRASPQLSPSPQPFPARGQKELNL